MARQKHNVTLTIHDKHDGSKETFNCTGCMAVFFKRENGDVEDMRCAIIGDMHDKEMLMMLRFLLDKASENFDDEDNRDRDIHEMLSEMRDIMLAKGKEISEGTTTVQ